MTEPLLPGKLDPDVRRDLISALAMIFAQTLAGKSLANTPQGAKGEAEGAIQAAHVFVDAWEREERKA